MTRTKWILIGLVVAVMGLAIVRDGDDGTRLGREPVSRVLVVALPGVGWSDVQGGDLPTLAAFVDDSAIADMSTRIGRRNATATDAYLTMSAGTRAVAPHIDVAVAVDPDDRYGGVPTADILERRLGRSGFDGIAYLAAGAARDTNDKSAFGAEVGLLGQTLADVGVKRSVIANADAIEGFLDEARPPDGYYARSAATMLMDSAGIVPSGAVGRALLTDDEAAPFGTRLDPDAVLAVFDDVWAPSRNVVLVEASDLSRTAAYRPLATASQQRSLRDDALRRADDLLARVLERVDPESDAVVVLSPVSPRSQPALGLVAVRAPGVEPGLLESPTTRRAGYVQLADVAPTVLTLLGEDFPTQMEGRSFHVVPDGPDDRIMALVDAADAARFRDAFLPTVVTVIVASLLGLLALALRRAHLPRSVVSFLRPAAYGVLGVVPGTFLAGQIGLAHASETGHWTVIAGTAVAVAVVAVALDRLGTHWGVIFAVGVTAVLVTGDVLSGATLQMNTTFGYSVAVAGRFTGLGNLAYALLGSAAIVIAALTFDRFGRRAIGPIIVLLVVVVLADGLPMLGADVGGIMSLVPAFGVTVLVLTGSRVRVKDLALLVGSAAATVFVFAFIDAARPDEAHTHLARLADHVLEGRWGMLANILSRRWEASFGSLELAGWGTIIAAFVVAVLYSEVQLRRRKGGWRRPPGLNTLDVQPTAVRAAAAGIAVLGVGGLIANDSSVVVPLTALIVAVPAYVAHTLSTEVAPS